MELSYTEKFSDDDLKRIKHAIAFATKAHEHQKRRGGEPYIVHPIAVAQSLIDEFHADVDTVITGLLHDTVEDTEVTLEDIEKEFGPTIRFLVDGVTDWGIKDGRNHIADKLERAKWTKKKVMEYAEKDPRLLLVKVADRKHNMHTVDRYTPSGQYGYSQDTLGFHVPIARRLGFTKEADELETMCLAFINKWKHHER